MRLRMLATSTTTCPRCRLGTSPESASGDRPSRAAQKQRISLARALYSSASTLLLDDIFSALDTHTTSRIYKRCFESGMVADRTVILVSHFSAAVADADLLIALDHGTVSFLRNENKEWREDADRGVIQHAAILFEETEVTRSMSSSSTGVSQRRMSCKKRHRTHPRFF